LWKERTAVSVPVPEQRLSDEPLGLHDAVTVLTAPEFDPLNADITLIDRQRSSGDMWLSIGVYGSSILFLALMEWLHRRRKRKGIY
jgi:hypothetical protein